MKTNSNIIVFLFQKPNKQTGNKLSINNQERNKINAIKKQHLDLKANKSKRTPNICKTSFFLPFHFIFYRIIFFYSNCDSEDFCVY